MQRVILPVLSKHTQERILDSAVVIIILLVGWVFTQGIEFVIDIGLYDEADYLRRGLPIPQEFPSAQYAPIYSLWYRLLSLVQPDTVKLYFLNYKLMTVLPAMVFFITLRSFGVSRAATLVISFGFLFSASNFSTSLKISHFALLLLLLGFLVSSFFQKRIMQTSVLSVSSLLVSYARPEFFLSFVCITVLLVFISSQTYIRTRSLNVATPLITALLICSILILWFGTPIGSGNRSTVAFGQHYAYNWVKWEKDDRNPWTNWKAIVSNDFGKAKSPAQALIANPPAVANHIVQNMKVLPYKFKSMLLSTYPTSYSVCIALSVGFLILVFAGAVRTRRRSLAVLQLNVRDNLRFFWFHLILLLLSALPVAISIVLIAPRRHYLFIFLSLIIFGLTVLFIPKVRDKKERSNYLITFLLCITVLMTTHPLSELLPKHPQLNLKTVHFLRSFNLSMPINILEAEGGYGIYVGENYNRIPEYKKNLPFADFLVTRSLNMIVVSPRLSRDWRFHNDQQWKSFVDNPERFDFCRVLIPGVDEKDRTLFVKRNIFEAIKSEI